MCLGGSKLGGFHGDLVKRWRFRLNEIDGEVEL